MFSKMVLLMPPATNKYKNYDAHDDCDDEDNDNHDDV